MRRRLRPRPSLYPRSLGISGPRLLSPIIRGSSGLAQISSTIQKLCRSIPPDYISCPIEKTRKLWATIPLCNRMGVILLVNEILLLILYFVGKRASLDEGRVVPMRMSNKYHSVTTATQVIAYFPISQIQPNIDA